MGDQYRFVGPVCFVLETHPEMAKPCVHMPSGTPVSPAEVWIETLQTWVRLDGSWISGWVRGKQHFGFRPHWLNRWKIRRAAKSYLRANPEPPHG